MPAYNFKAQFAALVESGQKRQTIRAIGKRRHASPGEALQLYTGQRTKACRKLVTPDPICTETHTVTMVRVIAPRRDANAYRLYLDGELVFWDEVPAIAIADGFGNSTAFFNFFEDAHGMPFPGILIKW
jgi:hypothetical protein